jgi:pimeloyl-ACP methyl ester carboxylesterase
VRERWIDVDGLSVHAVEWSPTPAEQGNGPGGPVLLVHGLGASTVSWELVGGGLAETLRVDVAAVDLGGFGLTRLPRGRRATVGANGRLLRALLDDGRGPAVIVGNSMGGAIGVGLAARHPELVRALVLVDPALPGGGGGPPPWQVMARFVPLMVPQVGGRVAGLRTRRLGPTRLVDTTLEWTLAHPERLDAGLRDRLIARATERSAFPEVPAAYAEAARSLFVYMQRRLGADLRRVECPTLIVHGALDRLVPVAAARAAVARRPDFTLEVVDDCGHAPQLEMPGRFLELVTPWLAAVAGATSGA